MLLSLLLVLSACSITPGSPPGSGGHANDTKGEDADWGGGCQYTDEAVGADNVIDTLAATPRQIADGLSGARSSVLFWVEGEDATPLDHVVALDASTARVWTGEWVDPAGDTGAYEADDLRAGGSTEEGDSGGDPDADDTGRADTGAPDTGAPDTGGGAIDDHECPPYVTLTGTWSFTTGDGLLAETFAVTARAESVTAARLEGEVDSADLAGAYAWGGEDPGEWDTLALRFAGALDATHDAGEVSVFGTQSDGEVAMAMEGQVATWPESVPD